MYKIVIKLTDKNKSPKSSTYTLQLNIANPAPPAAPEFTPAATSAASQNQTSNSTGSSSTS